MEAKKIKTVLTLIIGLLMLNLSAKASIATNESIKEYSGLIIIGTIVTGSLVFYVIYSYFSGKAEQKENEQAKPFQKGRSRAHHHQRHVVKKSA